MKTIIEGDGVVMGAVMGMNAGMMNLSVENHCWGDGVGDRG